MSKKSVKEIVQEKHTEFAIEVDRLSKDELKARIVAMQQNLAESEEHKANNAPLAVASATKSELESPYRDVKNAVKLKTKYLIDLINEKGG